MSFSPNKIISGGQTGVDRAALDFAIRHGIPYGGFVPQSRRAEDGRIFDKYNYLVETDSSDPSVRTRLNVLDAEVVLIICRGAPDGGTKLTIDLAKQYRRPLMQVDLTQISLFRDELERCEAFAGSKDTMIAGPRESKCPDIYDDALAFLESIRAA